MIDTAALSAELAAVVADVDGVVRIYPATAGVAAGELVAQLGRVVGHGTVPQLITVEQTPRGAIVRVRIAVAESASAREVSAGVYSAIAAHVTVPVDSIEVRVGSIG